MSYKNPLEYSKRRDVSLYFLYLIGGYNNFVVYWGLKYKPVCSAIATQKTLYSIYAQSLYCLYM